MPAAFSWIQARVLRPSTLTHDVSQKRKRKLQSSNAFQRPGGTGVKSEGFPAQGRRHVTNLAIVVSL
jgi:hypothetical protein